MKLLLRRQKILGHNYTGATIGSNRCFKNARVEIRARKPIGVQLHAALVIYTYRGKCGTGKHHGQVEIVRLFNESVVWTSLHHAKGKTIDHLENTDLDLNQYQLYGFEWNHTNIRWFINNQTIYQANQTQDQLGRALNDTEDPYYLPFDREFNILFHTGVGCYATDGKVFPALTDQDYDTWVSPHLDIDYIRVFGELPDHLNGYHYRHLESSTQVIISLAIILLVLIVLVVSLIYAMFKLRKRLMKNRQDHSEEIYDDVDDYKLGKDDVYDECLYSNDYTVLSHYEKIMENKQGDYLEMNVKCSKLQEDKQGFYLEMITDCENITPRNFDTKNYF